MNWSPLAISRLSEAAKYIALDSPVAAERWVKKVFDQVEKLSEFPGRGRMVPEVGHKTIREIIMGQVVPIVIHLMMNDHQRVWGDACYPVVD